MTNVQMPGCEFCKIARDEDDSVRIVGTAENWVAFFPLNPATLGHTLIIPRAHVANLWETGAAQSAELTRAAVAIGRAIKSALIPDGMNLITSAGKAAEQTIFHLHIHIVPRWYEDDFGPIWRQGRHYKASDLSVAADQIRQSYDENLGA